MLLQRVSWKHLLFCKAFAERGHNTCAALRHTGIHKSNHRHRRLLRPRRERPRRRRAAEQRDEIAPSHGLLSRVSGSRQRSSKYTTGVMALQGIKTQSKGWTMTASGRTRDLAFEKS